MNRNIMLFIIIVVYFLIIGTAIALFIYVSWFRTIVIFLMIMRLVLFIIRRYTRHKRRRAFLASNRDARNCVFVLEGELDFAVTEKSLYLRDNDTGEWRHIVELREIGEVNFSSITFDGPDSGSWFEISITIGRNSQSGRDIYYMNIRDMSGRPLASFQFPYRAQRFADLLMNRVQSLAVQSPETAAD